MLVPIVAAPNTVRCHKMIVHQAHPHSTVQVQQEVVSTC